MVVGLTDSMTPVMQLTVAGDLEHRASCAHSVDLARSRRLQLDVLQLYVAVRTTTRQHCLNPSLDVRSISSYRRQHVNTVVSHGRIKELRPRVVLSGIQQRCNRLLPFTMQI